MPLNDTCMIWLTMLNASVVIATNRRSARFSSKRKSAKSKIAIRPIQPGLPAGVCPLRSEGNQIAARQRNDEKAQMLTRIRPASATSANGRLMQRLGHDDHA